MQSGAVQQYTPAGAITDQSTKKKKAKHANRTSPLLRLRNAAPVNPEQVQQAFEFLGLPKPAPLAEANAGEARADGHTGLVASTGTAGSAEDHAVAGNSTSAAGREATDTAAPGPDTAMAEAALNSQAAAIRPGAAASVIMTPEAAAAVAEPAGATAVTDASPPAYAVQMDGPNDILHAKPQIQQQTEPQTGGISAGSVPGDDYLESVSRLKVPAEAALLSASQQAPPAITPPTAVESLLVAGADASTGDLSEKHRQVHNGSGNGFQLASVGQDKLNGQATTYTAGKRGPLDGDSIPAEPKKQKVLQGVQTLQTVLRYCSAGCVMLQHASC